jgi:hypothetical protein
MPGDLGGAISDVGAGGGFLLLEVLRRPDGTGLANWLSLNAARRNVDGRGGEAQTRFFWRDLPSEPVGPRLLCRRYEHAFSPGPRGRAGDLREIQWSAVSKPISPLSTGKLIATSRVWLLLSAPPLMSYDWRIVWIGTAGAVHMPFTGATR